MVVSLFGLILIQGLWIKYAIETEKARFDQLVYYAMKSALSKVERKHVYDFIDKKIELPEPQTYNIESVDNLENLLEPLIQIDAHGISKINYTFDIQPKILKLTDSLAKLKGLQIVPSKRFFDSNDFYKIERKSRDIHKDMADIEHEIIHINDNDEYILLLENRDSLKLLLDLEKEILQKEKENLVKHKLEIFNENVDQWVLEFSLDEDVDYLKNRMNTYYGSIAKALANNGINLSFEYQLIKEDKDTTIIVSTSTGNQELLSEKYKTEVYPDDIFTKNLFLLISFPEKTSHIYRKVYVLVIGSLIFTIIILLTFGSTLYYIIKQKKLSEIKSDFINNMTHEFKTPIATIGLAADALESPKVMGVKESTVYYLKIIRQENKRMNNQVERVLQMALIEKGKLQIDLHETDINSIINNCIEVALFTAKKNKGKITSSLRATCSISNIDEIHFANVLNNLLDNAIKYTNNPPDIVVETYNQQNLLCIRVSDNGIGMSKEVQSHIFDKFYRKPMGNIHNIKGFGLGLSYVKAVIEAHNGNISVTSEPDNGSTFIIKLATIETRNHERT